jgi:hypothetical protein
VATTGHKGPRASTPAASAESPGGEKSPPRNSVEEPEPPTWRSLDFWRFPDPGHPPLLPGRKAWYETAKNAYQQFDEFANSLPGEPDEQMLAQMARAIRFASVQASETRSYQAATNSGASVTAIGTGVLVSVVFAALAYWRWSFTTWYYLPAIWLAEVAFWVLARLFESYVFPGVLRRGLGFSRWPHTARLYGRTVFWLLAGISSAAAILTLSDRHHHLTTLAKIASAAPLGCLAAVIGLWTAVAAQAFGAVVRRPSDPYPELLLGLLEALHLLRLGQWVANLRNDNVLTGNERCWVADALERPARALRTNASMCTRVEAEFSPGVAQSLTQKGRRVAAWLHQLQEEVLWPAADTGRSVEEKLVRGLIDACQAKWTTLEADPHPEPEGKPNRVVKMLPRVALTVALVAAAFLIPDLLSKSLSSEAQTTLTVSLIVTALTALFAPSDAISTVASDIYGVGPPKSGQGK